VKPRRGQLSFKGEGEGSLLLENSSSMISNSTHMVATNPAMASHFGAPALSRSIPTKKGGTIPPTPNPSIAQATQDRHPPGSSD
jgi:hypothetical protein